MAGCAAALALCAQHAAAAPVVARAGDLTVRPAGYPTAAEPARQLASGSVAQRLREGRVTGTFVLRAAPDAATASDLRVAFGRFVGGTCQAEAEVTTPTAGARAAGFGGTGATVELDAPLAGAGSAGWDCAFAALTAPGQPPSPATTHDVLIGSLTDVLGLPRLRVAAVEVLRTRSPACDSSAESGHRCAWPSRTSARRTRPRSA